MAQRNSKVRKYRKPLNLNIGMIIFGVIFIYVVICVILYFQTGRIVRYEVKEGSLTTDNTYRGIALRSETLMTVGAAGYVNYYAREGERVAKNDLVYVVDETGRLNEELEAMNLGENTLSDRELAEFRNEIVDFAHGFDRTNYSAAYDFKYTLKNTVLKLANVNMLASVGSLNGGSGNNIIYSYAPGTGIVAYWTDGYETLSADAVSESVFDEKNYTKTQLMGNELRAAGDVAYKLVTDENWKLVFPLDAEMESYILDKMQANQRTAEDGTVTQGTTYIQIQFDKDGEAVWPSVTVEYRDGQAYGVLSFVNSMVRYANERYLSFEVLRDETSGLKIPKTAITEKDFYVIPAAYLTKVENDTGFMKQVTGEDGAVTAQFVNCTIYYQDEENAYVDPEEESFSTSKKKLVSGDLLVKTDSSETYQVGQTAKLTGVYNINKGYTIFRRVEVLYENEEYSIVKEGTSFGLSVYDRIVLNAATVTEDQVIY